MMTLSALLLLASAMAEETIPATHFDHTVETVITAEEPTLLPGRGPTRVVEYEVDFDGNLHVWAESKLQLLLRVDDGLARRPIATAENTVGTTPYVRLDVQSGGRLAVLAAGPPGAAGAITVHFRAAPESETTRAAAAAGRRAYDDISRLADEGDAVAAMELLGAAVTELTGTEGYRGSDAIATSLYRLGVLGYSRLSLSAQSHAAYQATLRHLERTRPKGHSHILAARQGVATTLAGLGDFAGAQELFQSVLADRERSLPHDHPYVLAARGNLASAMVHTGDIARAREEYETVLELRERTLPESDPAVLESRANLASALRELGDLTGARALEEAVLKVRERDLPANHPLRLMAQGNLSRTLWTMGDLHAALALQDTVLEECERSLPEGHPDIIHARRTVAVTLWKLGDLHGARAQMEAIVETCQQRLPALLPDLLGAQSSLAGMMAQMGDVQGARALIQSVYTVREDTVAEDHPDRLLARHGLAMLMSEPDELPEARAHLEAVAAAHERRLSADHPDTLSAKADLATKLLALRDFEAARSIFSSVLEAYERTMPPSHVEVLRVRTNLILGLWEMGDHDAACALAAVQATGLEARILALLKLAPRQAREAVGGEATSLTTLIFLGQSCRAEMQARAFELQETMRMVVGEAARAIRHAGDHDIAALLAEAGSVRARLAETAAGAGGQLDQERIESELGLLHQERDRLERRASRLYEERDLSLSPINACLLSGALGADGAAIAYRRVASWPEVGGSTILGVSADHLLVHLLAPDGSSTLLDLGEAAELESLAVDWRRSMGTPLLGRGAPVPMTPAHPTLDERDAGGLLRERLIDPVLDELNENIHTLFVCADDFCHAVPLDALPVEGGRLGDRYQFVNEVSFSRLQSGGRAPSQEDSLLVLGGAAYDQRSGGEEIAANGGPGRPVGSERGSGFEFLPGTREEAEALGDLFARAMGRDPHRLLGAAATKEDLAREVGGKRFVHLATHGWFAPESVLSATEADGPVGFGLAERVTGLAPMLLCGLALAGANHPRDSLGRMPGILTAEELCTLDLSACDLAVLSACETNVGIRRAGLGLQSLQAALYAAGARSSITSLWKVSDAATRRLMELFYTKLWEDDFDKGEALWQAKRVLRAEGNPVRDWAGWVLTGDPN